MARSAKELAVLFSAGAARLSGLPVAARYVTKSRIPILTYHSISDSEGDSASCLDLGGMRVAPQEFRAHMQYVAKHYNTVTLEEVRRSRSGQSTLPQHPCVITFDDGYFDTYENAVPVLQEFGLKATFFIIGRPAATGQHPWLHAIHEILDTNPAPNCAAAFRQAAPDFFVTKEATKKGLRRLVWRYLLEEDPSARQAFLDAVRGKLGSKTHAAYRLINSGHVRELHKKGFEIGCHSMDHEYMTLLSCDRFRQDIRECKQLLGGLLGRAPDLFCYPFGAFDARIMETLRREGFAYACTTRYGLNDQHTDPHALCRIGVYTHTTFPLFIFRLVGLETASHRLYKLARSLVGREGN